MTPSSIVEVFLRQPPPCHPYGVVALAAVRNGPSAVAMTVGSAHRIESVPMVLELAILNVVTGRESEFEAAFSQARRLIAAMPGFVSLELGRNTGVSNRYVLLVQWRSVEDHTEGFRKSQEYVEWSRLLHHFYEPFPTVEYYRNV